LFIPGLPHRSVVAVSRLRVGVVFLRSHVERPEHDSDRRGQWDQKGGIFTASLYFILSFTGAYYSFKCYQIVKLAANLELNPLNKRRRQKLEKFLFLIPLFFVIFFLRFLWSALYFLNANPLQGLVSKWIKDHNRHSFDDSFI